MLVIKSRMSRVVLKLQAKQFYRICKHRVTILAVFKKSGGKYIVQNIHVCLQSTSYSKRYLF